MPAPRNSQDTMGWESTAERPRSLADMCTDAFLLIFHIRAGNDPGPPDKLREDIAALMQHLERQARRAGYPEEDTKAARYALLALIDETILNSQWGYKDQWADRPLQLEHFGEHMAGERFFDLLDRIRQKGARKVDLLEIFASVLIFGFQGKYKLRGRDELNNLTREIVGEIVNYRGGTPALSPHGRIPDEAPERQRRTIPVWVWATALGGVALVILVFIVLKLYLGSQAADSVSRMVL